MTNPEGKQETEPTFDSLWEEETGTAPPATGEVETETGKDDTTTPPGDKPAGEGAESTATDDTTGKTDGADDNKTAAKDWIDQLPPEMQEAARAERKANEDRYNALHGRVAPMQRTVADLQRRLSQPAQTPAAASTASQDADSFFDSDDWKKYEADFPGDAKVIRAGLERQQAAVDAKLARVTARVDQLAPSVEAAVARDADADLQANVKLLTDKHPDWQDVNASDEFWDWFEGYRAAQPAELQGALYDEGKVKAMFRNATWTAARISEFKNETGYVAKAPAVVDTSKDEPAGGDPNKETDRTQTAQTAAGRLRMAAAPDVRTSGTPRATVPVDSLAPKDAFEAIWNQTN